MDLSDAGAAFIAKEEGAVDHWYRDTGGVWTIGIGHVGDPQVEFLDVATEDDLSTGHRLSEDEMWRLFRTDARRYIDAVNRLVTVPLTQTQFDMLVDFAFNWGIGEVSGFPATSVLALINAGDFDAAAVELVDGRGPATPEFPTGRRYDKDLAGVRNRRKREASAFAGTAPKEEKAMKLVTRAEWGARSTSLTALDVDMVSVHWEGPHMGTPDHARCAGIVKGFQNFHIDDRGWTDIAYNAVVCPHGYVFEGRGRGKRSAANGDTASNSASYAVCFMGGEGDTFTAEAKDGINDAAEWLVGPDARWGVHRDWVSTACPGDEITAWVRAGHPRANATPTPTPTKEDELFSASPVYTVHIIASHSGLLLTSDDAKHGAGVTQQRANGSLNQRWEVWGHDNGEVSLVNRAGGFALDRPDYSTDAGTLLQVARTEHNAAQRWTLDQLKPYLARLWAPGTNRCVDVRMRSVDAGAGFQLWYGLTDEDDPRHQQFVFAPTV